MIKVRFFGLLRLNSGVKSLDTDAGNFKELLSKIEAESGISIKTLKACTVLVNGKSKKINQTLQDGDEVVFLPPVCGG